MGPFIDKLEKSKSFFFLLAISTVFFLLRLPSLVEPYWYGDEGVYQVIGQALNNGRLLYSEIWDNKPPLLYVVYALFDGEQQSIRFFSLLVGILSTIVFFHLAKKLFKHLLPAIISTVIFTLLFATPYLEGNIANAENFMLLPIILAGLIMYQTIIKKSSIPYPLNPRPLLLAGLLLGLAFLFKIVAIFDLAAFLIFLTMSFRAKRSEAEESHTTKPHKQHIGMRSLHSLRSVGMTIAPFLLGFLLPLLITILYFAFQNTLADFIKAAFFGNIGYVGWGNKLSNIPQGLLILKLVLLGITILVIALKKNNFSKPALFILLWLVFSLFNAFFSQRPYTHYLLVLLPSFCLLVGLLFTTSRRNLQIGTLTIIAITLLIVGKGFHLSGLTKTLHYYQNIVLFVNGQKNVKDYQSFFDTKAPRDYELALFIKKHTSPSDAVFIWGNNPQIYALSHKLPPNKYTVAYHITQNKDALWQTQQMITTLRPKYIITLSEAPLLPFSVPLYKIHFVFPRATIYEREL